MTEAPRTVSLDMTPVSFLRENEIDLLYRAFREHFRDRYGDQDRELVAFTHGIVAAFHKMDANPEDIILVAKDATRAPAQPKTLQQLVDEVLRRYELQS